MNTLTRCTLADLIAARANALRWSSLESVQALTDEINRRLEMTYAR
jgi:hypothetical protein